MRVLLVVDEIKALLAHIVASYDIKFEEGKGVPREFCNAGVRLAGNANVMSRTRQNMRRRTVMRGPVRKVDIFLSSRIIDSLLSP